MNGTRRSSSAWDPNSWKDECLHLTQDLLDSEDSVPFRQPVDPIEVPVSLQVYSFCVVKLPIFYMCKLMRFKYQFLRVYHVRKLTHI